MAVTAKKVWMNGELVEFADAKVHVLSHAMHYGSSVFEGIRAYDIGGTPHIVQLRAHTKRLIESAHIYRMEVPYSIEELEAAQIATIKANEFAACYIRPLVFRGFGPMGVNPLNNPVDVSIAVWEWGAYLGAEALEQGVDVQVSSWTRFAPNTLPAFAKCGANYMNSQLIKMEAVLNGFAEGIALTTEGYVCEGSGENIFLIKDGVIHTPPGGNSILMGITRAMVMQTAREAGYEVVEGRIPREMLYLADEVFFTGTASEITPIRSIDRQPVGAGSRGPITKELQEKFLGVLTGERPDAHGWLTPVN
jgi:branched-chain amino acid aminotransferase